MYGKTSDIEISEDSFIMISLMVAMNALSNLSACISLLVRRLLLEKT